MERCRRVGVSGSLRGRRSEDMTQSNTSSPWGSEVTLESQKGVMAIEVPQNEEISGEELREKGNRFYHPSGRSE